MPLDYTEFSKKIKNKYPEYSDVDDLTLAKKMVEKYPEYKNDVSFESTLKKKEVSQSTEKDGLALLVTQETARKQRSESSSQDDGIYVNPWNNENYKRSAGKWYKDITGSGDYKELKSGDLKERYDYLNKNATKIADLKGNPVEISYDLQDQKKVKETYNLTADKLQKEEKKRQSELAKKAPEEKAFTPGIVDGKLFNIADETQKKEYDQKYLEYVKSGRYEKDVNAVKKENDLNDILSSIDSDLIGLNEDDVVSKLQGKLKKYDYLQVGPAGYGYDGIEIKNTITKESKFINLNNWTTDRDNKESKLLKGFLEVNIANDEYIRKQKQINDLRDRIEVEKKTNPYNVVFLQKELDELLPQLDKEREKKLDYMSKDKYRSAAAFDKYEIERINDNITKTILKKEDIKKEVSELNEYEKTVNESFKKGLITEEDYNTNYLPKINQRKYDIDNNIKLLKNDYRNISNEQSDIKNIAGNAFVVESERGNILSGTAFSFVQGMEQAVRAAVEGGEYARGSAKGVLTSQFAPESFSEEYLSSENRNAFEQVVFGLANSGGSALAGAITGSPVGATIGLFGASYTNFRDQMNSPEFKDVPEYQKILLAGSVGAVTSLLEKYGLTKAFSKSPVNSKVVNYIFSKSLKELPENATAEMIENSVEKQLKGLIANKVLKISGAGLIEYSTEAGQELTEIGAKELLNQAKGKKYFENPKTWGEVFQRANKAGMLGLLGGAGMQSLTQATLTAKQQLDKYQLQNIENAINSKDVKELFILNIKDRILSGEITKDQGQAELNSLKESEGILRQIPDNLNSDDKYTSFKLINERENLRKQMEGKDPALVTPISNRVNEINNELKTISENAVQKQTTGEVSVQPEARVGREMEEGKPQAEPKVVTEEGQKEEVNQYIANIGAEARIGSVIDPIVDRMSNAEYINDKEIDNAIEKIFNEVDSLEKSDYSAETKAAVSEKLLNIAEKLDNYEFRTKTETVETTKAGTTTGARKTSESIQKIRAEKYFNGVNATVNGQEVTLVDRNGRVEATMPNGEIVVLDTPTMQIAENGFEFDDNDALVAVTVTDRLGNNTRMTGDQALDFAIRDRENKIGVVEQADFDIAYQEVERRYVKEAPKKKVEKELPVAATKAEPVDVDDEVRKLEELLKRDDPNFQLDSEITQEEKKEELVSKAIEKMSESDINDMSEESFDAEFPSPDVKTYPIEVKENSELANKLKRMGLKDLIGKKINLVMADQLKVGEVMGKKRMGGPFFPLIDKLFGKVAWASINKTAAKAIVNGAIKSDYTVVYNMNPSAIDSNAAITETFEDLMQSLPKNKQKAIFSAIQEQVLKNKYATKTDQVRAIAKSSNTLSEFFTELDKLDVDTISAVVKNIMPSRDVDAGTKIGKLLQNEGITIETIREMNVEQFASELPAGALTMVLEVTDKSGNKVTAKTADEAIITPEQQDEEGLPKHNNYPIYVRGKAVAMLNETVPFWNILKESINNINVKVAGIVREKSGRRLTAKEAVSNEMRSASMTASVAKKAIEKTNTQYNRFLSVIAKSFPNVEVVASQEEFDSLLKDLNTKKLSTKNAKVYGAVYKGKLYLNPSLENYNTPIHEFGHVWINTAKVASKQLYSKGISLVKGTEYENNVRENKEYQRVIKQMKVDGASDIDIDNYIYEEALATAIGDKGESFVTASQRLDFKNWMRKLFSFVKSMTGISKYNAEQLEDITLDEFVQAVSIDIMSGTELFKGVKTNISDALQLMTNGSKSIEYIMSVARDNGISDAGIKKYLANQGFSEQAIKDAFKAQVKAPSAAKILGKPIVTKVTVNEYTALKDQIRMEARAARDAKADLNTKRKMLSDAISNMVKLGKIKTPQAGVLIKRISYLNLDNPVMVERFTNYAERVFQRADYQDRLSKAFAIRKSIRKDLKTDNQAEVVGMAKEFTKIDPSLVEDIDAYMEIADKVKNAVKPSRRKDEEYVMKQAANIADISEFSKNEINRQEQIKIDELIATYEDIEGLSKDMSFNEIQKIINSLKENPNETVDKESKAKEFLVSRMNGMKSTLETMFKTGVDPMTGEEITFEDSQKDLMKRVLKIDLNEMSTREAIKIVEGVDNFITNQITSGLEAAASSYEGALNVKSLVNRGKVAKPLRLFGIKTIGKVYSDQLYSLPNLMEKMFGGVTNSIDIMRKMGLLNVINGVNKAIRQHNQIIDKYSKQLFAKGKDFMDAKNVYERGMLAELKRNIIGTKSEMQAEFQNRVKILKESIDLLIEDGNSKEKKMGELYKEVYDKLNVDSMDMDVINANASKNNLEAVDWWINEWSKYKPELFDVSLSVYNTMLTSDLSYTPRSIKNLSSKDTGLDESLTNQNGSFNVSINNVDKNKSGVLMETTRTRPTNGYISLDFDTNNSKALKSALTDINTASAIRQVDGFLSSKEFKKLVPESDDRTILERRISTYIKRAKGKNVVPRDTIEYLNKFVNYVTSLGVGKALAGVNQTLMQTTPVLVNTLMNAGRLDFVNADFNAWLDETGMPISNRGFESQSTIDSIDRQLEAKGQTTDQVFKKIADINQWWLKQLLVKPDVWVARSSFKSYYLQNLNRRGISTDIDWKNHKMDKEAAEYAQIMVDRQQNISDPMLSGEFLASENPYVQMTRKIFLPFASFILNQKARMYNDLITVSSGTATNEDKAIAWRSLRGLGAELATYQLLGYGIKLLYDYIAASLLGDEDDEETKKKKIINATKNPIKSVLNDIISPLPMLDDIVTIGLNLGLSQYPWMDDKEIKDAVKDRNKILELKGEDPMDAKTEADYIEKIKKEATYQLYISDDNDRKYGMIGIAGDTYKELGEISKLYATGEFIDDYQGRETPKKLLEADRKDVGLAVFPTLLYSTGLLPKDVGAISRDYIKRIKKKAVTEKQYDRYETVQKDLGRNLKSWEIEMVKDKKESETAISEIKFIERNGGLTERQGREYLKLMKAIGEPTVSDLTKIKNGQTADQILK